MTGVAEFAASGRLMTTFGQNLDHPAGIATDATGHVWVADTGHDRVVEFSPVGRVLAIFGSPGRRPRPAGPAGRAGRHALRRRLGRRPGQQPGGGVLRHRPLPHLVRGADAGRRRAGRPRRRLGSPARPTRRATRSGSSPRPGISCGRSAPPRRATATSATPAASRSARPAGSTSRSRTTAWCRCSARPGASTPSSACSRRRPGGPRTWSSRRAWRSPRAGQIWVADSGHNRVVQFGRVPGIPATGAPAAPGGPSRPLIISECLLALIIAGLGWHLARRQAGLIRAPRSPRPIPPARRLPPPRRRRTHPPPPAHHRHRAVRAGGGHGGAAGQPAPGAGRHARGPARRLAPATSSTS